MNSNNSKIKNSTNTKKAGRQLLWSVSLMLVLAVLSRIVSCFRTMTATDIAYADWIPSLLSYIEEILISARCAIGFAGIVYSAYENDRPNAFLMSAVLVSFADYAARFLIDLSTSAISGSEQLAIMWLLLQFFFEAVFIALTRVIAAFYRNKAARAETERARRSSSASRALLVSVILQMAAHIALEAVSIIDFISSYTNITSTETASMIGSVLKIIFIYGGVTAIISELYLERISTVRGKSGSVTVG